jgi:hypothetical protein
VTGLEIVDRIDVADTSDEAALMPGGAEFVGSTTSDS